MSALCWLYLGALLLTWTLGEWVAECSTLTLLLAYAPPLYALWPAPLLLLAAVLTRSRRAALPLLMVALCAPIYAGVCLHPLARPQGTDLKLLSYNLGRGTYGTPQAIARYVLAQQPDIITLQEANFVRPADKQTLLRLFAGYHVSQSRELLTLTRAPLLRS